MSFEAGVGTKDGVFSSKVTPAVKLSHPVQLPDIKFSQSGMIDDCPMCDNMCTHSPLEAESSFPPVCCGRAASFDCGTVSKLGETARGNERRIIRVLRKRTPKRSSSESHIGENVRQQP